MKPRLLKASRKWTGEENKGRILFVSKTIHGWIGLMIAKKNGWHALVW